MFWYENDVLEAEKKREAYDDTRPDPFIFYGSSSFNFWGGDLSEDMGGLPVLNLAFGGSTLAACNWFFKRVVAPAPSCGLALYAGDNDIGADRHSEEVALGVRLMAQEWARMRPGQPMVVVSIKPSPSREHHLETIRFANRFTEEICDEFDHCYYVDVFDDMLDEHGRPDPTYYEDDMLHMNRKGFVLWASKLKPLLLQISPPTPPALSSSKKTP